MTDDDWESPPPPPPATVSRNGTFDPESYVLACCLMDQGESLAAVSQLASTDFRDWRNGLIFSTLRQMRESSQPIDLSTLAEELGPRLSDIGGIQALMALDDPIRFSTTAHLAKYTQRILQDSANRREVNKAKQIIERAGRGEDVGEIGPHQTSPTPKPRPITSYAYPHDDDPSILLGKDDYLGKGGGMLFVSHAGAGKSSWIMDACMMWALGRPWMGIRCARPLRSLIIQAEDSDRYVGKIYSSFAHKNSLSPEQISQVGENCRIVRLKGVAGPKFFSELSRLTTEHNPDLVIINPLYLYADGDISRSEFAQPFLIELDRVNSDEKFAYILIHHTGKPQAKGNNGKRAETEDWESAYMGFGSSYLANWPRCTALLEPVPATPGRFTIKLGKGGYNAGVTREVPQGAGTRQEIVTRIHIKHSEDRMSVNGHDKPVYYWEECDPPSEQDKPQSEKSHGRPEKYQYNDYRSVMPPHDSKGLPYAQLHAKLNTNGPIGNGAFTNVLKRWEREQNIEVISVMGQPNLYRAAL